jgi:8-oxo-dGTP pyrophosphatase MutT (NUDIX family)
MTDFEQRLAAVLRAHPPRRVANVSARRAAVLIPVMGEMPSLLFTVRTDTLPTHRGQISFPGGAVDATDASAAAAALREAREEIGVEPPLIRVLGELDALETFVSGYVVTPVVGWIDSPPRIAPNPAEVADVFSVPIVELTEEIRADPGFVHAGRSFPTEAWIWKGRVIWGLTARIVRLFLVRLGEAGLAEPPGDLPSSSAPVSEPPPVP